MEQDHIDLIRDMYGRRAPGYDEASGGWHVKLGQDFVTWIDPKPGETALDLACGTGLVTLPLAQKLGTQGKIVAVDLTPQMVQVGKERLASLPISHALELSPITWVTADITSEDLLLEPMIQQTLEDDGGFDIISICSALVLLPDQRKALQFWTGRLLKKGGRLIVDVPTEDLTLQFIITDHLPAAIGLTDSLSNRRAWIEGRHSLSRLLEDIGLSIELNVTTESYLTPTWYDSDSQTGLEVLERQVSEKYPRIADSGKMDEARSVWCEVWQRATRLRPDGGEGVEDTHRLYVCVGRKP